MRIWILLVVVIAACKADGGKAGPASGQSLHDALGILCGSGPQPPDVSTLNPAERQRVLGDWLDGRIQHPQVRALVAALGDSSDRAAGVRRAAAEAGMPYCKPLALFESNRMGGADLPAVVAAPSATAELDQDLPIIVITPTAIVVDGRQILAVRDGAADPAGWSKLGAFLGAFAASGDGSLERVVVAADRTLTTRLLVAVLDAAIRAGARRVELAVAVGDHEVRLVPVSVPKAATGQIVGDGPLGMVADIGATRLVLFSTSGQEGTLVAPRLEVPLAPPEVLRERLQESLGKIVGIHWRGKARSPEDHRIVVWTEAATTVQTFAEILVAVRAAPDGTPLFPEIVLGRRLDPPTVIPAPAVTPGGSVSGTNGPVRVPDPSPPGTVKLTAKQVPPAVMQKIQSAYARGLRRCYDNALKADPAASGTLDLSIAVAANGRVTDVTAAGHVGPIVDCIVTTARNWRFAPPEGNQAATYVLRIVLQPG